MAACGVDVQQEAERMLDGLSDDALRVVARAAWDRLPGECERRCAPKRPPAIPDPPKWLNGEGVKLWDELASVLRECGRLTRLDTPALALMCQTWGHLVEAARMRDTLAFTDALENFVMLADRFEMVPRARL